MLRSFLLLLLICFCLVLSAQEKDTSVVAVDTSKVLLSDSIEVKKIKGKFFKKILDKTYPNPERAAAMSFILPGTGQIYNKKWWKAPIIYGALGGAGFLIYDSNKRYKDFQEAYLFRVDDDPNTIDPYPNASEATLLSIRNRYDKRRQQSYVAFFAVWLLNSIDAFVDAHLVSFDVNEDLSLVLKPSGNFESNIASIGVSFSLQTKHNK